MITAQPTKTNSTARYALYFSPSMNSELANFGKHILGRTSTRPRDKQAQSTFPDQERWLNITAVPAHYGFHATLKAPFELKDEFTESEVLLCAEDLSKRHEPKILPGLAPRLLSRFFALTVTEQSNELSRFAFACVNELEHFRKPLTKADIVRRKARGLNKRQEELLDQYGYPFIDDEFNFHMTLSGKLSVADIDYHEWVANVYQNTVSTDPVLDQVSIFKQIDREHPFKEIAVFSLQS